MEELEIQLEKEIEEHEIELNKEKEDEQEISLYNEPSLYTISGIGDYEDLDNIPQINNVELIGNKSLEELGIQEKLIAGENIEIKNNTISVQTTNKIEENNTKPITSSAVYTEVGNISALLQTI